MTYFPNLTSKVKEKTNWDYRKAITIEKKKSEIKGNVAKVCGINGTTFKEVTWRESMGKRCRDFFLT